jgi:hypothetical protein
MADLSGKTTQKPASTTTASPQATQASSTLAASSGSAGADQLTWWQILLIVAGVLLLLLSVIWFGIKYVSASGAVDVDWSEGWSAKATTAGSASGKTATTLRKIYKNMLELPNMTTRKARELLEKIKPKSVDRQGGAAVSPNQKESERSSSFGG